MTPRTYQDCYRALGIASDCTWRELRLAYRRRVRSCHPDLKPTSSDGRDQSEEFKKVVHAYRQLAHFHVTYGELPPPWLSIHQDSVVLQSPVAETRSGTGTASSASQSDSPGGFHWRHLRLHAAVFAAFVSGVCATAILETLEEVADSSAAAASGELAVGMDAQSVVEIQGVPNHTKGSVWFYGESGVIFDKGCVVGWQSQEPIPLRTLVRKTYLTDYSKSPLPARNNDQKDCLLPGT